MIWPKPDILRCYINDGQRQHYHEGPTIVHNTKPAARIIETIHTSRSNGHSYDRLKSDLKKAQHLREVFQIHEGSVMSKKPRMDYPENEQQIFFSDEDLRDVQTPHDDPLVIKLRIGDSDVKRLEKARDTHTETYSSCEELDTVIFSSDPEKYFKIGRELSPGNRTELIDFLVGNVDVFAWDPYEVPGVDPNYIEHRLNTDPHSKPVQQKARRSAPVHAEAIALSAEDREKTAFITPLGIYCYKVMPFGLKNAGATYQRMVTKMFKDQIGKTMEIYIDDMVVKKQVVSRPLKGFDGDIPDQIKVIQELKAPRTHKEVQRLTVSSILCKQNYDGGRNALSPFREGRPSVDHCGRQATTIFSSTHRLLGNAILGNQYPVQAMFNKADFTGRIWKWGAKISALGVKYLPRTAIKGQVLADFVAEFAPTSEQNNLGESTPREDSPDHTRWWKVYVDGASNSKGSGTGVLAGLKSAKTLGARRLIVYCDSLLVASQINGEYMARDERMSAYLLKVQTAMTDFETVRIEQIGRNLNNHADALATLASVLSADFKRFIPIETLTTPSTDQPANYINAITVGPCWMDPYVTYLKEGVLPEQKKEAEIIRRKTARFWLSKDLKLYRRSFSGPYLLCVHPDVIEDLLYEIHEGICGSHTGGRSLAHRALTQGYWWPYMQKDAVDYVRKCDKCQRFSHSLHQPGRRAAAISSEYPRLSSLIMGHNSPVNLSRSIASELGIKNVYSSPAYPQSNGQAEASNKTVLDGIKKRLEDAKGRWVEELPNVLWTFRTTPRRSTGETPFSLAYGSEAVIPLEIGLPTLRTSEWEPTRNDLAQSQALDLLEERREQAMIRLASYQQQLKKGYNKNIRPRSFQQGDLVLRKVLGNTKNPTDGKLGPNWEGPYRVRFVTGTGAYHLEDLNSLPLPRPWNVSNLRKYFH
uniref:Integrase catalytic domain-containing protein n=1 Tax=Fagus sylvatica TaxID=28930 RepID=A0A2N9I0Z3_FAGSY